ncbi:hypothetical protein [Isoptericola aurantiacus]|uniref:hypothetical protein n=1 Tax=Isoptericola aurantiacus TaxID=3377839 RepID=UPI00383AEA30
MSTDQHRPWDEPEAGGSPTTASAGTPGETDTDAVPPTQPLVGASSAATPASATASTPGPGPGPEIPGAAPEGAAPEGAPVRSAPLVRTGPRTSTIVWGLIVLVVGSGLLARTAGATIDTELAAILLLTVAGALLLVGSLVGAARRRRS